MKNECSYCGGTGQVWSGGQGGDYRPCSSCDPGSNAPANSTSEQNMRDALIRADKIIERAFEAWIITDPEPISDAENEEIRKHRDFMFDTFEVEKKPARPEPKPVVVTHEMVMLAMRETSARDHRVMSLILKQTAWEYRGEGYTAEQIVKTAVERFVGSREAWREQGALRGEAWKQANPNWKGGQ